MAENLLLHEESQGIHWLTMNHGPNALDRPLMEELRTALQQLAAGDAPAVILDRMKKLNEDIATDLTELEELLA